MSSGSFYIRQSVLKFTLAAFAVSALAACTPSGGGGGGGGAPVGVPVVKKVDRENYQSGKQFCKEYESITKKEFGKYIVVPLDYENPSKGSMEIYAYTMKPFNPKLPSYIYIDGGPGQNTHGLMPEFFFGEFNEIRFDQRGLGCSSPDNYDLYKDQRIYSTENTVQDIELIRNAYDIEQWSVYGVSYGTVPATMYGSKFAQATKSVVLEGVLGRPFQMHELAYKAEKINLAIQDLNLKQRETFSKMVSEGSEEASILFDLIFQMFYQDKGMRLVKSYLLKLILADGSLNKGAFEKLKKYESDKESRFRFPQQPGAVDENILRIIQCKNLGFRSRKTEDLFFSESRFEFYTKPSTKSYASTCDEVGVTLGDESPYVLEHHPVDVPIYYFQGSHDGATLAKGAFTHWSIVAKAAAYFLMAQKGGHNPNLARLEDENRDIAAEQSKLFRKAFTASPVGEIDLVKINLFLGSDSGWKLYLNVKDSEKAIVDDQQGIFLSGQSVGTF